MYATEPYFLRGIDGVTVILAGQCGYLLRVQLRQWRTKFRQRFDCAFGPGEIWLRLDHYSLGGEKRGWAQEQHT